MHGQRKCPLEYGSNQNEHSPSAYAVSHLHRGPLLAKAHHELADGSRQRRKLVALQPSLLHGREATESLRQRL